MTSRTAAFVALALAVASVRPAAAQTPAGEAEVLTLDQALALARKNSAAVLSAEAQVLRASEEVAASRTRRLPALELQAMGSKLLSTPEVSFPAGAFGSYPGTGPIPGTDTIVRGETGPTAWVMASAAQPLTQLHKAGLGIKASELTRDSDQQQLRLQRAQVAHDVRRFYYAALQARGSADAAREQVKALRQMDEEVRRYVSLETALPSDGMEVKSRLAAQEYQVIALDNALESDKEQLNVLFGRDPRTPFDLVPLAAASLEEVDVEAARTRALECRPELEQSRIHVELADTQRRLKKAELIPEISFALTYNSFFNVDLLPQNIVQLGLQLKWEPFDWGRRRKELASKTLAVDQARLAARDQRNRVLAEVDDAFRQVQ
jgi:outer membrane protein TolC